MVLCSIQRAYFEQQEKLGKIKMRAPTPRTPKLSLKEKYGVPEHLDPIMKEPEQAMALTLSRQLWGNAVPGPQLLWERYLPCTGHPGVLQQRQQHTASRTPQIAPYMGCGRRR
jgi:hypothetical protein